MALPEGMQHVDKIMTNISLDYMQDDAAFIADRVFPVIGVTKDSDFYVEYLREDLNRNEVQPRANGTESQGGDYRITTDTYYCQVYAYHQMVTQRDRVKTDNPMNADRDATRQVTHKLMLFKEVVWANTYFTTGVWTTDITGVATVTGANEAVYWDDYTNSNPIKDIRDAMVTMLRTTGVKPNTLVLGFEVYVTLLDHPVILDRINGGATTGTPAFVNLDLLAKAFDVERVLVPYAIQNLANRGATENEQFIFGKGALLMYVTKQPGLYEPTAGYTFAWTGLMGANALGGRIIRLPMNEKGLGTVRIEGELAFDQKVVDADLGVFFDGIIQ